MTTDQSKTVFIYALKEPDTGEIRYIGKSIDPEERLKTHIRLARKEDSHKARWIRKLLESGFKPVLEIVDEVPDEFWQQWEAAYIDFFRGEGFLLVNGTSGGDGSERGVEKSEEHRRKIGEGNRGKKLPESTRRKIGESQTGRIHTVEHRKKNGDSHRWRKYSGGGNFLGVFWHTRDFCWRAQIVVNGRGVHLGYYDSEEDAAYVFDYAAKAYFGESAKLNFP